MSDINVTISNFPTQVEVTDSPINIYVSEVGVQGPSGANGGGGEGGSTNIVGLISTGSADLRYLFTGCSGQFYLNSNPYQYIKSGEVSSLLNILSGALGTNAVYTTGNQTISGIKTFISEISISGDIKLNNGFKIVATGESLWIGNQFNINRIVIQPNETSWEDDNHTPRFWFNSEENGIVDWEGSPRFSAVSGGVTRINQTGGGARFLADNVSTFIYDKDGNEIYSTLTGLRATGTSLQNQIFGLSGQLNQSGLSLLNLINTERNKNTISGIQVTGSLGITGVVNFIGIFGTNLILSGANTIGISGIVNNNINTGTNTGIFNSGDLFYIKANNVTNANVYAKDTLSGLFNISTSFQGITLDKLNNELFIKTQMGANGYFKHGNLSAVDSFRTKLAGTGLINVIYAGDGYVSLGLHHEVKNNLYENFGTGGYGSLEFPFLYNEQGANTAYINDLATRSSTYLRDHLALTTGLSNTISIYSFTNAVRFLSNSINLFYVANTGAGNFTISTGIHGGSYAYYSGINANAGSAQCRVANIKMTTPGFHQIRISGSGDTSFLRIPHVQFFNSTANSGRLNWHNYCAESGPSYASAFSSNPGSIKNSIRDLVFSGTNPDLIIHAASMGNPPITSAEISGLNSYLDDLKLKWPNCSVVVCGIFPNSNTTDNSSQNATLKQAAHRRGYAYFDAYNIFTDRATWVNRGFSDDGYNGTHFSTSGQNAYGKLLWNWLNL